MNNFQIISKIGEGSFATVYKAKRKSDGKIYALKLIKLTHNQADLSNTLNQVRILASIHHPHIIAYKEAFYEEKGEMLALVTEFADGGDLVSLIRDNRRKGQVISEEEIWKLAIQMLLGLKVLHSMHILHRDIKPANILISGNVLKLADLNISKISHSGLTSTQAGTPYYTAPQIWQGLAYSGKCDVWSVGCVVYELCSGRAPFSGATDMPQLKQKINRGEFGKWPSGYSRELEGFVRACLQVRWRQRPSTQNLLRSSFIRKKVYLYPQLLTSVEQGDSNKENSLLQTIRPPRHFSHLKGLLPKPNYPQIRQQSVDNRKKEDEKLPPVVSRGSEKPKESRVCILKGRVAHLR